MHVLVSESFGGNARNHFIRNIVQFKSKKYSEKMGFFDANLHDKRQKPNSLLVIDKKTFKMNIFYKQKFDKSYHDKIMNIFSEKNQRKLNVNGHYTKIVKGIFGHLHWTGTG